MGPHTGVGFMRHPRHAGACAAPHTYHRTRALFSSLLQAYRPRVAQSELMLAQVPHQAEARGMDSQVLSVNPL